MKRCAALAALVALMAFGCVSSGKHREQAGKIKSPATAQKAATNGAYASISTNLSTERAANRAITQAATNAQSVGGSISSPGGVSFGGGAGTGEHGPMFWFYIALGAACLVWLALTIWSRAHARKHAKAPVPRRRARGPPRKT